MKKSIEPYGNRSRQKDFEREEAYLRAQKKVKRLVGFYWHLASYVIVNLFLIILFVTNGAKLLSFATFSTALFWGIGLLFHFLGVFGPNFFFGSDWEERKIQEMIEKDTNDIQRYE
ncbi:MAG: 2TM domain-containing protein [Psychroserpens sp.]|uniref:2TM domain-containing protein n=1 Tax=Psychroserpens sp. TaxID=2020870 RepID=UPI003C7654B7